MMPEPPGHMNVIQAAVICAVLGAIAWWELWKFVQRLAL